jgi:hypothetical protein
MNGVFYFKEVRFSQLGILLLFLLGSRREHTPLPERTSYKCYYTTGKRAKILEFRLFAWPKENSATWTLLKRSNFPTGDWEAYSGTAFSYTTLLSQQDFLLLC